MADIYYVQVIRQCNQNCRFCSNPSNGRIITHKNVCEVIDKYAKLKAGGLIFTGGEPTLYPHLAEAIKYAASKKLHPRITTNGQRCSDIAYMKTLKKAGLGHIHFSLFSHRKEIHEYLTRTKGSFNKILQAIDNAGKLDIRVDINTVINKKNSKELHSLVEFLAKRFPFITHIIFNNMDPGMDRTVEDKSTIPVLSEFEASLAKAMRFLSKTGRTFRVERVPLCFMSEFPQYSTETRKIIKSEDRRSYFLDEKKMIWQIDWQHEYDEKCKLCGVKEICAGLFEGNKYYKFSELSPIFYDVSAIKNKVLGTP